jgi:O-acetyl-ADP-ribose deacetylase (regulator of RNase III)
MPVPGTHTHGTIRLIIGDITKVQVDAIVNAANESLLGGGGVDGAIHRAAGPELLAECRTLGGCPTGQARITNGYRLPARHVIHTVGPVYRDGKHDEAGLLVSAHVESIRLAVANGVRTLAFPAISCGVYGYPLQDAANIALGTVGGLLRQGAPLDEVLFVLFNERVHAAFVDATVLHP